MLSLYSTREKILRAAIELFTTRGFENTSVQAIQAHANIAVNTFYRYFPSKEQLVNEIYQGLRDAFEGALEQAKEADGPRSRFHQLWVEMGAYQRNYPQVISFLDRQYGERYLDKASRALPRVPAAITEVLVQLQQEKMAKQLPPALLGAVIWGAFLDLAKARAPSRAPLSEDDIRGLEDCTWDAVRARAAQADQDPAWVERSA